MAPLWIRPEKVAAVVSRAALMYSPRNGTRVPPPVGAPSFVQAGLIRLRELSPVDRDSDLLPV